MPAGALCESHMVRWRAFLFRSERLISAIQHSSEAQEYYGNRRKLIGFEERSYQKPCRIVVSPKRTLEAAAPYGYAGKKVCVLNFASATNPGGGVTKGSSAQEEAICRCSTLYANLKEQKAWDSFYGPIAANVTHCTTMTAFIHIC